MSDIIVNKSDIIRLNFTHRNHSITDDYFYNDWHNADARPPSFVHTRKECHVDPEYYYMD